MRNTQNGLGTVPGIQRAFPEGELARSNVTAPHKGQVGSIPGVLGAGQVLRESGGGAERGGQRGRAGARAAGAC